MMDLVRSQTDMVRSQKESKQKLESLARSQSEQSQSTKEQLAELVRGQADLAYAQIGYVAEMANITGRISSVEKSLHGTPSASPIPGRRGSSPSAETIIVSVPPTSGYLVPMSQSQVRRSERLLLKPRPHYRLLNRSAIWQDRSITEVDEDAEYEDPTPLRRETQLKTIAGEMTFRRGPGDILSREIVREGQDVVVETDTVRPEVNIDLANKPFHPPETSFRVAPEVEESIGSEDVRKSRMSRTLMDTECKRNNGDEDAASSYCRSGPMDANVDEAGNQHVRFRPRINDENYDDTMTPFVQSSSRANVGDNEVPTSYFRSRPE